MIHPVHTRIGKSMLACRDPVDIVSHRNQQQKIKNQCQNNLKHKGFPLPDSEILRVYQCIKQVSTQEQYNYSKYDHSMFLPIRSG